MISAQETIEAPRVQVEHLVEPRILWSPTNDVVITPHSVNKTLPRAPSLLQLRHIQGLGEDSELQPQKSNRLKEKYGMVRSLDDLRNKY